MNTNKNWKPLISRPKNIHRGEIWWAELPAYSKTANQKKRPAVIVSNEKANRTSSMVTVVPLTTKVKRADLPCNVVLNTGEMAKCNLVMSIDKDLLISKREKLKQFDMEHIELGIIASMELA